MKHYPNLDKNRTDIEREIEKEERGFRITLRCGIKKFEKIVKDSNVVAGIDAFLLFSTHGFPIELTLEFAKERGVTVDEKGFKKEMKKHQVLSRTGAEQKFKGGLADSSEKVIAYHTVTHLLLAGLKKELGGEVHQAGSNITGERLRFDFTHSEKVSKDALEKVENFVNNAIKAGASVVVETMSKNHARSDPTVEGSFWDKCPDEITVYTIKDGDGIIYSRELCGGPHVKNTGKIKGVFRIIKEEAISVGVRRVRAVLE